MAALQVGQPDQQIDRGGLAPDLIQVPAVARIWPDSGDRSSSGRHGRRSVPRSRHRLDRREVPDGRPVALADMVVDQVPLGIIPLQAPIPARGDRLILALIPGAAFVRRSRDGEDDQIGILSAQIGESPVIMVQKPLEVG
ncbi:MAG: hypothetical protein MZU79_07090 [Anaerotruncus sp.]|nr:hypothetical protein [Anaerotruncus sp.]